LRLTRNAFSLFLLLKFFLSSLVYLILSALFSYTYYGSSTYTTFFASLNYYYTTTLPSFKTLQNSNNMSTAAEPNNNVMTIQGTPIRAQTAAGADYVSKVCHPPTTIPSGYGGTPDASMPNFVPIEVKCESNIPVTYQTGISNTVSPFIETRFPADGRILLVGPSGGYVANYVFYWTGQGWLSAGRQLPPLAPRIDNNTPATTCSGYNFANFHSDISSFRTVYKSSTFYLNATDFNNQGTVTTAKFKPDIYRVAAVDVERMEGPEGRALRRAVAGQLNLNFKSTPEPDPLTKLVLDKKKSSHVDLMAKLMQAKLNIRDDDSDFEVIDEAEDEAIRKHLRESVYQYDIQVWDLTSVDGGITTNSTNPASFLIFGAGLPQSPADVLTMSPKGVMRAAKDGAFVVSQPVDPVQLWTSMQNNTTSPSSFTSPANLTMSLIKTVAVGTPSFQGLNNGSNYYNIVSTAGPPIVDMTWNNLDWHYTIFDGLSAPTFNTSGIPINAPYITDKTYFGIEGNARSQGSLTSFQRLLPLPDPEAMQMAVGIFHARPDSLPASANDFGTLATLAVKMLPTAVTWLKQVFGRKNAAPQPQAPNRSLPRPSRAPAPRRQAPQNANLSNRINALTAAVTNSIRRPPAVPRSFVNSTAFGNLRTLVGPPSIRGPRQPQAPRRFVDTRMPRPTRRAPLPPLPQRRPRPSR